MQQDPQQPGSQEQHQPSDYPQVSPGYPPPGYSQPMPQTQQPVGFPSAAYLQSAPRKKRRTSLVIGGVVGTLLILCCVGVMVLAAQGGKDNSTSAHQANASTATPKPTATVNPNAGLASYSAVVQSDSQTVSDDLSAAGNDCGASDINSCYSDMQTVSDDVHRFQSDLNAHPAPPCLKSVDSDLRSGLQLIEKGAQSALSGIKQNDPTQVDTASSYFTQGTRYINKATTGLTTAHC